MFPSYRPISTFIHVSATGERMLYLDFRFIKKKELLGSLRLSTKSSQQRSYAPRREVHKSNFNYHPVTENRGRRLISRHRFKEFMSLLDTCRGNEHSPMLIVWTFHKVTLKETNWMTEIIFFCFLKYRHLVMEPHVLFQGAMNGNRSPFFL